MRTKVVAASPVMALTRLLEALGQELLEAADEEVIQAAKDLGMDPAMPVSAAFAGLRYPARVQLSDFFDLEGCRQLQLAAQQPAVAIQAAPKRKVRVAKRRKQPTQRKGPAEG